MTFKYEDHEGGSASCIFKAYGVYVGSGSFVTLSVDDADIALWGGETMFERVVPLAKSILKTAKDEKREISKEDVQPLKLLAFQMLQNFL